MIVSGPVKLVTLSHPQSIEEVLIQSPNSRDCPCQSVKYKSGLFYLCLQSKGQGIPANSTLIHKKLEPRALKILGF